MRAQRSKEDSVEVAFIDMGGICKSFIDARVDLYPHISPINLQS